MFRWGQVYFGLTILLRQKERLSLTIQLSDSFGRKLGFVPIGTRLAATGKRLQMDRCAERAL